jgi:hypothetical protein
MSNDWSGGEDALLAAARDDWPGDGDALLAALREAVRDAAEVPREFVEAGHVAYRWYAIDAELAELTYDSAAHPAAAPELSGARGGSEQLRSMTFEATGFRVDVEVTPGRLKGQIQPRPDGGLQLVTGDGTLDVVVDGLGWFDIRAVPAGLFRLRWLDPNGGEVLTVPIKLV